MLVYVTYYLLYIYMYVYFFTNMILVTVQQNESKSHRQNSWTYIIISLNILKTISLSNYSEFIFTEIFLAHFYAAFWLYKLLKSKSIKPSFVPIGFVYHRSNIDTPCQSFPLLAHLILLRQFHVHLNSHIAVIVIPCFGVTSGNQDRCIKILTHWR